MQAYLIGATRLKLFTTGIADAATLVAAQKPARELNPDDGVRTGKTIKYFELRPCDSTLTQCERATHARVIPQLRRHNIIVNADAKQRRGHNVPVECGLHVPPNGAEKGVLAELATFTHAATDNHPSWR
jgi:hypothetical protein